jgi:hypothetical protein
MLPARWNHLIWLAGQTLSSRNAAPPLVQRFLPQKHRFSGLYANSLTTRGSSQRISCFSSVAQSQGAATPGTLESGAASSAGWKPRWEYIGIFGKGSTQLSVYILINFTIYKLGGGKVQQRN